MRRFASTLACWALQRETGEWDAALLFPSLSFRHQLIIIQKKEHPSLVDLHFRKRKVRETRGPAPSKSTKQP
jgi:hypothetical protein